jgi:hypothetical protein
MNAEESREDEVEDADWDAREALEDPDGPQECDLAGQSDADETDTVPCPNCGKEIAEDADKCPHCGEWVVQGGDAGAGSSHGVVFMMVAILVLIILAYWLL